MSNEVDSLSLFAHVMGRFLSYQQILKIRHQVVFFFVVFFSCKLLYICTWRKVAALSLPGGMCSLQYSPEKIS